MDDGCPSRLSEGKLSNMPLDQAPARVRRHGGCVAFETPMVRGRPFLASTHVQAFDRYPPGVLHVGAALA